MTPDEWLRLGVLAIGAGIVLVALDQFGLWLERRGWLYYRKSEKIGTAASNVFVEIQSFADPSAQHLHEIRQERGEERRADDPIDRD